MTLRPPAAEEGSRPAGPRPRPCASCPYRRGVPSGVWDAAEYVKLPAYDLPLSEQPPAAFRCHQGDGSICSGWLGHRNPEDLLAVRLGVIRGRLHPSCLEYRTDVPLFGSGADAAAHGTAELTAPNKAAQAVIAKLIRSRGVESRPDARPPRQPEPQLPVGMPEVTPEGLRQVRP
uniref:DUF6283 family protein n=1 Tax=Pigmentiphaga litoralis TaxID=516702 RepID=UPI003899F30B